MGAHSEDDSAIADAECLWRRVHPTKIKSNGEPDSNTFKTTELSVDRKSLTTLDDCRSQDPGCAVFEFTAGAARELGLGVKPDVPPPSHALVLGTTMGKVCRRLRSKAIRVPGT